MESLAGIRCFHSQDSSVGKNCYCHFGDKTNFDNINNLLKIIKHVAELGFVLRCQAHSATKSPASFALLGFVHSLVVCHHSVLQRITWC